MARRGRAWRLDRASRGERRCARGTARRDLRPCLGTLFPARGLVDGGFNDAPGRPRSTATSLLPSGGQPGRGAMIDLDLDAVRRRTARSICSTRTSSPLTRSGTAIRADVIGRGRRARPRGCGGASRRPRAVRQRVPRLPAPRSARRERVLPDRLRRLQGRERSDRVMVAEVFGRTVIPPAVAACRAAAGVEGDDGGDRVGLGGQRRGPGGGGCAQAGREVAIVENAQHRGGERGRIARRHQQRGLVSGQVADAADVGGDDRPAGSQRFLAGSAAGLPTGWAARARRRRPAGRSRRRESRGTARRRRARRPGRTARPASGPVPAITSSGSGRRPRHRAAAAISVSKPFWAASRPTASTDGPPVRGDSRPAAGRVGTGLGRRRLDGAGTMAAATSRAPSRRIRAVRSAETHEHDVGPPRDEPLEQPVDHGGREPTAAARCAR